MNDKPRNDDAEFLLSELLDGRLGRRQSRAMQRRMEQDPNFAGEYRRYAALDEHLKALGAQMPDVDYEGQRQDIMAVLERRVLLARPQRWARIPRFAFWGMAAAAAAVMVTVATFWPQRHSAAPSTELFQMAVIPASARPSGPAVIETAAIRNGPVKETWDEPGMLPLGTVVVSVAADRPETPSILPVPITEIDF